MLRGSHIDSYCVATSAETSTGYECLRQVMTQTGYGIAVERIRHKPDSQGQILALSFGQKSETFHGVPFSLGSCTQHTPEGTTHSNMTELNAYP